MTEAEGNAVLEPTPNYDTHIGRNQEANKVSHFLNILALLLSSQVID